MFRMLVVVILACLALSSAFAPSRSLNRLTKSKLVPLKAEPGPSYWEGSYPPSSVLGIGEKVSSKVFGPMSMVALLIGLYCVNENNISNQLSATNVNPSTILGSLLVPISWGMHVAAWIQQKNGK